MKEKITELTCIMCPVGCNLLVKQNENGISVTGNSCPRGHDYGIKEVTSPERIVTSVLKYKTGTITVKTSSTISKSLVDSCLRSLASIKLKDNIKPGDKIVENILNTNVDIIVTSVNK